MILRGGFRAGAAVAVALALVGCGRSPESEKVIRVTRNIGGREGFRLHWEAWKGAFERQNPGWRMELIDLGNSDGAAYYKARIATGDLPDVVMTWLLTGYLADGGNLQTLPDAFYEKFGVKPPPLYKGKRYACMCGRQIQGIAVNKAMWSEIGITEPPETWADLMDGLRKLKEKGRKPLVYGGREWSAFPPLSYSIQVNLYDPHPAPGSVSWTKRRDQKSVAFATDPTARLILENMIRLVENFTDKGAASDGYNEEQRQFYGGKGATWIMGCWIGGDLEPNRVDFEIDYWPFPPLARERKPAFIDGSELQCGWAVTTAAQGEKRDKAIAVLEAYYDPAVYQLWLNGEAQFSTAAKVPVKGPKSEWAPAQKFYDNMAARLEAAGSTPGYNLSLEDMPPLLMESTYARVMQEILAGNRDVDKLLKMMDDDWDSARKGM